jgi:hypothetical protein
MAYTGGHLQGATMFESLESRQLCSATMMTPVQDQPADTTDQPAVTADNKKAPPKDTTVHHPVVAIIAILIG